MNAPVLVAENLICSFPMRAALWGRPRMLHALRGVSFEVARGETLAIVGESGCGKTTLGRVLLGLQAPDSGRVRLCDRPLEAWPRTQRARQVQAVFQDPYSSLNPYKSVAEIISFPLRVQGELTQSEIDRRVYRMLELTGLPAHVHTAWPGQLSGGQRQRVAIARALATEPATLICDEPTSALDVSVQSQILNLLKELKRELGLTLVFISHNLAVVENFADRVGVMYFGRIVEMRETSALFADPSHPYTIGLLRSMLAIEPGVGIPDPLLLPVPIDPFSDPSGCALAPRCFRAEGICNGQAPPRTDTSRGWADCHFPQSGLPSLPVRGPLP